MAAFTVAAWPALFWRKLSVVIGLPERNNGPRPGSRDEPRTDCLPVSGCTTRRHGSLRLPAERWSCVFSTLYAVQCWPTFYCMESQFNLDMKKYR